ncbi:SCO1664 family protein [Streptomyces sp. NBRC 109706]|uniref:SCO1664 family protein n=1 Tax=Streptomyces sp. NBRC 109706 TaxID=1550035 RepID=UPI000782AA33|nr:SCO1664 family protein [Streptomyces sp. NBRC 109706]
MSAPERIPSQQGVTTQEVLSQGELTVVGRITDASNAVLYGQVELAGRRLRCVYKPVSGERPLWDFPDGTLAEREVASYEVCRALGWDLVPPTVLRDGPLGDGMCQLWVGPAPEAADFARGAESLLALVEGEHPEPGWKAVGFAEVAEGRTALLVHADDARLRRLATLDAVINNADRKGGHLLPLPDGRLYGIDHGVTFHVDNKLRTLLWGWAGEPLPAEIRVALGRLAAELADDRPLFGRLGELLTEAECQAVRERVAALLAAGSHPAPSGEWPAIPWPLV